MMMKTIILLAFTAACISASPGTDKLLLTSLFDALNLTMKDLPNEEIFLCDLKVKGHLSCTNDFFCQAENELTKKISGLSGPTFSSFRTDQKLMRNLHQFNKRHEETCKPADKDEILLPEFLNNLRTCVQKRISHIP